MTRPKLHRCADLPGHELRAAVAQLFRFRALAGGDAQDLDIVLVNPLAGRDRFRGEADHLAELENWLAWSNGCRRHFVPAQDALTYPDALDLHRRCERIDRDNDVILLVQAQKTWNGNVHGGARRPRLMRKQN